MNMSLTTKIPRNRPTPDIAATHIDVVTELRALHLALDALPSLAPGASADDLFARLVRLVLAVPDDEAASVLADPIIRAIAPQVRELCARGETELEFAWSERVLQARSPFDELALFPYIGNYRRLSRMEAGVLASAVGTPRSLAFVGAGPLPLSALFLARELDVTVDLLDNDPAAVDAAARLVRALGVRGLESRLADAAQADLSGYDVVVLAALVGETADEKRRLLGRMSASMAPGSVLVARSARGLRTLLYPAVEPAALDGYEVLSVVHPVNDVINSAVLARTLHGSV